MSALAAETSSKLAIFTFLSSCGTGSIGFAVESGSGSSGSASLLSFLSIRKLVSPLGMSTLKLQRSRRQPLSTLCISSELF